jgi:hypothetical protein
MNKPLQALELMKSIDPYINNEIKWFFLITKCLMITNQWKEIEAWKYRYMFLPENQLQANKFYLGEIGKIFSYHTEMVDKERGILMRDIENEADWSAYGMKLQMAVSHNNEKSYQRALATARNIFEKARDKSESKIKSKCRNIMAEAYQGMEQFDEAAMLIKDNLEMHSNNIQTLILQMRNSLHGGRFAEIREA